MRVLYDRGAPAPLRHALVGHTVETAFELGWATLQNGALIAAAQAEGFEVFLTTDKNLKHQQNLAGRATERWMPPLVPEGISAADDEAGLNSTLANLARFVAG